MTGIYKIQSQTYPDRIYVGSAVNFNKRFIKHLWELRNGIHPNEKLQRHINKYGINDLAFIIITECNSDELLKTEQSYIDSLSPYFNILKIAGSHLGAKRSISMKNKMRKLKTGTHATEETKQKIRDARKIQINTNKGMHWKLSPESCQNISNAHIGLKRLKTNHENYT
jgi:group I intron endonuclease